jgi:hypothetical protein
MYSKILVVPAENRCFAENFWRGSEVCGNDKIGKKKRKKRKREEE